ncbi:hypothetical protein DSO57_1007019 [Entomophthora muscae]|uniref:Uncharacterized protein n=1 Tax=Entomophthora muscae TaxID=34485 RepID=A0ACC2RM40_9FUNG|nr:hypothetical protein DSO57_1007019 [Entomophthora muscae]
MTQGWDLNPAPKSLRASGPMNQGAACLCFPEVKPPQAEAKNDGPNGKVSQTKEISALNGGVIKVFNGCNKFQPLAS